MIVEGLSIFGAGIIRGLFTAFQMFSLPVDMILVLCNILKYGVWVVGSGVLMTFVGCIMFWITARFSIGLALFVWRLLPLT